MVADVAGDVHQRVRARSLGLLTSLVDGFNGAALRRRIDPDTFFLRLTMNPAID
jgi:hypothetical protein